MRLQMDTEGAQCSQGVPGLQIISLAGEESIMTTDRRVSDRRGSLTDAHFKYLDVVAEIAVEAGRTEADFVADFMDIRRDLARQAYREAQAVSWLYDKLILAEKAAV